MKRDADGNAIRMVGSISDITERYEAEESLRRERDLFSGGPVLTTLRSAMKGWPILQVSPNVGEILGYSAEEMREENFFFADYIIPMTSVCFATRFNRRCSKKSTAANMITA